MKELSKLDTPVLFTDGEGGYRKYNDFTRSEKLTYNFSIATAMILMTSLVFIACRIAR